jgi:hypothetical protein
MADDRVIRREGAGAPAFAAGLPRSIENCAEGGPVLPLPHKTLEGGCFLPLPLQIPAKHKMKD